MPQHNAREEQGSFESAAATVMRWEKAAQFTRCASVENSREKCMESANSAKALFRSIFGLHRRGTDKKGYGFATDGSSDRNSTVQQQQHPEGKASMKKDKQNSAF